MTALEINLNRKFKGVLYRSLKSYIVHHFDEEEYTRLMKEIGFDAKNPLPSSWYPSYFYHRVTQLVSEKLDEPIDELTVQMSKYNVKTDLNGIYRFFMRVAGVNGVLQKMANLNNAYSNYSKMTVVENQNGKYGVILEAPAEEFDFFACCLQGGTIAMLEIFNHRMLSFAVSEEKNELLDDTVYKKALCITIYQLKA